MAVSIQRRKAIPAFFIASVIAPTLVMVWPDKKMISRDIGCAKVTPGRGREICQVCRIRWNGPGWGHAIISPGWRVTWKALRRVYCREKISSADLSVLENLKMGSDWRLQDGADELIRLVGSRSGSAYESENSIFNPTNPQYILKNGCVGEQ